MKSRDAQARPAMLAEVVDELERGGAGRPEELARRLAPDWRLERVRATLAELFSGGVVGHNHEVGFWWVA